MNTSEYSQAVIPMASAGMVVDALPWTALRSVTISISITLYNSTLEQT